MSIKETYKNVRYKVRDIVINSQYRKRLTNHDFSIISCDCLGGGDVQGPASSYGLSNT